MIRLLQGDVGSGKTVVALLAMADVIEAGRQAAMMAPTEVLARQHFERIAPLAEQAGLRVALMTGRDRASERRDTLAALAQPRDRHRGRHARPLPGKRRLRRSRARGRRRAAPLRRAAAPGSGVERGSGRSSGDDRDADSALAGARLFRRHGRFRPAREAAGATADRHPRHADRAAGRGRGGPVAGARLGGARLLDLPAGGRERNARRRRGGGTRRSSARHLRRRGRASSTAGWRDPRRMPRWSASSAAKQRSWSRPRSSRSASTCRRRPS